jgi:alpha-amylase
MRRSIAVPLTALLLACATPGARPAPPAAASTPASAKTAAATAAGAPASPGWWKEAVFYEVFVRSFQDSGSDGAGDLKGLTARLDYLNDGDPGTTSDLGVDAIWLMPIFASPSYHGYDATDYERIQPDYGTGEDFQAFIAAAHRRGIKVIVDLVLNHTSRDHPWFRDAVASTASPKRDWYVWSPADPGWSQPWNASQGAWHGSRTGRYYGVFWAGMPDLNWRNPAVAAELDRVAALWLGRGVDGFRLDAVRYLVEDGPGQQADRPGTHAVLKRFAAGVRAHAPGAALVGEAWADTLTISDYYGDTTAVAGGDELPLLFDFPLASAIVQGLISGSAEGIDATLREVLRTYPKGATDAPFLTNHDQQRIATQVGGDPARLRLAAALLLTMPGAPFIYYGEELGLQNGPGENDESKRTPMPWDATASGGFTAGTPWYELAPGHQVTNVAAELKDPGSLLSRYRELIRLRHGSAGLRRGALQPLDGGSPALLAFTRVEGRETVLVVHNLSGKAATSAALPVAGAAATPLLDDGGTLAGGAGAWIVTLPPRASGIWRF